MLRDDETEQQDRDAEAQFWREWDGKSDCFGTVAKVVMLLLIVAKTLVAMS